MQDSLIFIVVRYCWLIQLDGKYAKKLWTKLFAYGSGWGTIAKYSWYTYFADAGGCRKLPPSQVMCFVYGAWEPSQTSDKCRSCSSCYKSWTKGQWGEHLNLNMNSSAMLDIWRAIHHPEKKNKKEITRKFVKEMYEVVSSFARSSS